MAESFRPPPLFEAILELVPRTTWSAAELAAHRRRELQASIAHAVAHSRFHADRLGSIEIRALDPEDLAALPTMTKSDLMAAWDDVVTDPALTLARAREHLARVDADGLSLLDEEYFVFTTGGSTGEPGVFCWSSAEMARWGASGARWSAAGGAGPPARQAWVGARSLRHPSAAAYLGGQPELLVPIDQPVAAIVDRLNQLQPDMISTVASMLPELVAAAERGELVVPVERLALFGDVPDPAAVDRAHAVFGVVPAEGYPTTDVGYVAVQAPDEDGMYVCDDLIIVEPVDEQNHPVPPGTYSDHLLVTSLHQRTLPLIRYRIDDRVLMAPDSRTAYGRILRVDGRSDDIFRYGEVAVHPHGFRSALAEFPSVVDFTVEQTPTGARVAVRTGGPVDTRAIATRLTAVLERAGLADATVEVLGVEELARSGVGKRRRFVPLGSGAANAQPATR